MATRYFEEDDGFIATAEEFPGLSAFGETREEAIQELEVALGLAIEEYLSSGWPLPEPAVLEEPVPELPSGEFRARLPRSVHYALIQRAKYEGVSLNTLLITYVVDGLRNRFSPFIQERHVPMDPPLLSEDESEWTRRLTKSLWTPLLRTPEQSASGQEPSGEQWESEPSSKDAIVTGQDSRFLLRGVN